MLQLPRPINILGFSWNVGWHFLKMSSDISDFSRNVCQHFLKCYFKWWECHGGEGLKTKCRPTFRNCRPTFRKLIQCRSATYHLILCDTNFAFPTSSSLYKNHFSHNTKSWRPLFMVLNLFNIIIIEANFVSAIKVHYPFLLNMEALLSGS